MPKRLLGVLIVAWSILLVSAFFPFVRTLTIYPGGIPEDFEWSELFWSFKGRCVIVGLGDHNSIGPSSLEYPNIFWKERFFGDYFGWASNELGYGFGLSLILMFGMQVLTLLCAFLAILKRNQGLLVASGVTSALVMASMFLAYASLGARHEKTFEIGFWLTFLSMILLSSVALANSKRTRTVPSPS